MLHLQLTLVFVLWLCLSITPALAGTVASGGGGLGGGGGGSGDASLAEQQTQTGLLTTIDADTGTIAGAVKAEDAAHSSGHTGIPFWGVRNDNGSTIHTDANGDYTPISTDSAGRLIIGGVIAGNGGAYIGKAEDAVHSSGDAGVMALCVRQDTAAALATTDGDYIPCATDATGRMWTNTELPDAAALADGTSNPTTTGVAAYNMCFNGTTWDRCVKASAGAGNSDSSTQRVVVARDSDVCNPKDTAQVVISTASSGNVELVALTSGQTIYLCDFTIMAGGTVGVQLIYVTGTGAVTQTVVLKGSFDSDGASPTDLCTITLSGTAPVYDVCQPFTAPFPYLFVTTTSTTGTGASGTGRIGY